MATCSVQVFKINPLRFWFVGGLFKLPTASTLWILLELGWANVYRINAERRVENEGRLPLSKCDEFISCALFKLQNWIAIVGAVVPSSSDGLD